MTRTCADGRRALAVCSASLAALGFTSLPAPTQAQATPARSDTMLEEVIVTAQKREQNLQDVGVSVTAISGDALRRASMVSSSDIMQHVPNLSIGTPVGDGNNPAITLRGVGLNDFGDNNEGPVAVYIDDVYQASMAGQTFQLFDMDRIEVLRGPQGTLYGRNTTGGLVNFISTRPSRDEKGYASLSYGRFNSVQAEAALGGPLTESVQARVSLAYNGHDGIVQNKNPANPVNPQNANSVAARLQVMFEPTDEWSVLLNAHGVRNHSRAAAYKFGASVNRSDGLSYALPATEDAYGTCPGCSAFGYKDTTTSDYSGSYDTVGPLMIDTFGSSVNAQWTRGTLSFVSITGYEHLKKRYVEDSDMSPDPATVLTLAPVNRQFTQELRLSQTGDALTWVGGAYFFGQDVDIANRLDLSGIGFVNLDSHAHQRTRSWSGFGQLEFKLNEKLTAIVGLRYTHDDKRYSYLNRDDSGIIPGDAFDFSPATVGDLARKSEGHVAFKTELDWRPTEGTLVYGGVARGQKGGGFNLGFYDTTGTFANDTNAVIPYDNEELTSYEAGVKTTVADGRFRINASVFYYDYKNFQVLAFRQQSQVISNANAKIMGYELELTARPAADLHVTLGIGGLPTATAENILNPANGDIRDRRMVLAPKLTVNLSADYEWHLSQGVLGVYADAVRKSAHNFDIQNHPVTAEAAYTVVNARLAYRMQDGRYEVAAFCKNLTGERYRTYVYNLTDVGGYVQQAFGSPRWCGVSGMVKF